MAVGDAVITSEPKISKWKVTIILNKQKAIFKIDTGAQCNVIPKWKYQQVCQDPLQT